MPTLTVHCPRCAVELTIPVEAGVRRLRCPKCAERFYPPAMLGDASKSVPNSGPIPPIPKTRTKSEHLPDLRDMLDIPLADDVPLPARRLGAADAAALLRDDGGNARRRTGAVARAQSRICPSCGSVVLAGMSLCGQCGLDLDTGQRAELDIKVDEAAPPTLVESGPPAIILVIGLLALVAGLFLAVLSIIRLNGLGAVCLTILSLFGVFAAVQFLRGQTLKLMVVALMLGAGVDLVAMIVMPVLEAEVKGVADEPTTGVGEQADPVAEEGVAAKPLSDRIDSTKLTLGVLIFVVDAVLLVAVTSTGVRAYFVHERQSRDESYVIT